MVCRLVYIVLVIMEIYLNENDYDFGKYYCSVIYALPLNIWQHFYIFLEQSVEEYIVNIYDICIKSLASDVFQYKQHQF